MADLDLIPQDYRDWLSRRAILRQYAIVFVVVNILILASTGALARFYNGATQRIQELQAESAITEQQQTQLETLREQQAEYERRWSLLRGLRAGAAVEDIFRIIDEALVDDDLWFVDWSFRRAGVVVNGESRDVETGYFVMVLEDGNENKNLDWKVETLMTVSGQARDHQALSTFVRALFEQPSIRDVSVRKTSRADYAGGRVVSFELGIVLNSAVEKS
jgi:hypothetical protein